MANSVAASRNPLIIGVCLPLAVLIGYLLAEPLDSGSVAVVVLVMSILCVPLVMRWHHPLLILSWNAAVSPYFLPGRPTLWMLMAGVSLLFALVGRATNPHSRFLNEPPVTKSLLFLGGVVLATALATGGLGVRALGSGTQGGKGYFYIFAAIIGYFALTSRSIPPQRAKLFFALFFLSGLTTIISNLAYLAGPKFYFLYELFPPEFAYDQAMKEGAITKEIIRISGLISTSQAIWCLLLGLYGIQGIFDFSKPWRLLLLSCAVFAGMLGGFRSGIITFFLTFGALFWIEKLWRTRFLAIVLGTGVVGAIAFVPFIDRMPLSVQRTLSFLPIEIDPMARIDADASIQWRLDMWNAMLPELPKYLLKGKGYSINPGELHLVQESMARGYVASYEEQMLAGNYHNGPLSILVPFGIFGMIAFLWFLIAGGRALYLNYRFSEPHLKRINTFMLAWFVANSVFFFMLFGAINSDLFHFTGLVGLSIALNAGVRRMPAEERPGVG